MRSFCQLLSVPVFFSWMISSAWSGDNPAQEQNSAYNPDAWKITLKANLGASSKWNGSDSLSFSGYPSISFRRPWAPEVWESPDDSIGFSLFEYSGFSAGLSAAYRGGRDSDDEAALAGIHKTRWTIEGGFFAQYWAIPDLLRARMEVRRGFRNEDGFIADLGLDFVQNYSNLTLAVGPRLTLADSRFMRYHFGVSEQDALNSSLASYKPSGGFHSAGIFASADYKFDEKWTFGIHGGWDRLLEDAADSPVIKQAGSRDQFKFGATVKYTFDWE